LAKHFTTLLKVSVTAVGLIFVLYQASLAEIRAVLSAISWPWLAAAFLLVNAGLVIRAFRWFLLLRGLGISVPLPRLVGLYLVGNFFNAFLPSAFGGDVVRVLEIGRDVSRSVAAGTVLVDRMTGLMMLFLMALLFLPWHAAELPTGLLFVIVAVCVLGLLGGSLLLWPRLMWLLLEKVQQRLPERWLPLVQQPLNRLLHAITGVGHRALAGSLVVSIFFNLILVGWWTALGRSMGLAVPYTYYLLVVPILSVALLMPSIGGLGVRESIAPLLLLAAGLTRPEAVALSLLEFALVRLSGLLGAPVYLSGALSRHSDSSRRRQPMDPGPPSL
jgi:glycosyltransferase 2 family protein